MCEILGNSLREAGSNTCARMHTCVPARTEAREPALRSQARLLLQWLPASGFCSSLWSQTLGMGIRGRKTSVSSEKIYELQNLQSKVILLFLSN